VFSISGGFGKTILFLKMPHIGAGVKVLDKKDALATNIGDTFLYEKGKESRGEAGKARDARAA
jgi:hypothetical protein